MSHLPIDEKALSILKSFYDTTVDSTVTPMFPEKELSNAMIDLGHYIFYDFKFKKLYGKIYFQFCRVGVTLGIDNPTPMSHRINRWEDVEKCLRMSAEITEIKEKTD